MSRTALHRAFALVLGVATGGGLWWVGTSPGIAGAAGVAAVVLGLVAGRAVRAHPEFTTSTDWRDNWWGAAGQAFVTLVGFSAVFAAPVALPDQTGLLAVVLVTYLVGYLFGGMDALGREATGRSEMSSDAEPADD